MPSRKKANRLKGEEHNQFTESLSEKDFAGIRKDYPKATNPKEDVISWPDADGNEVTKPLREDWHEVRNSPEFKEYLRKTRVR